MISISDGRNELYQWDTGSTLTVDADCSQVHFSNKVFGRSIDVDVVDSVAIIPDILLQTDKDLTAWAFVGTAENGYTKISRTFKVNRRNKPADYVFTPTDQTSLEEIKEKLDYLESIQDPDAIKDAVEDYLEQNPVEAPVQSVNGHTGDVELTAEDVGARPETWIPTAAEVGALPSETAIPQKTSDLINDSGFITKYTETDPTVPAWAKQPQKPSYTAAEVGAQPKGNYVKTVNGVAPDESGNVKVDISEGGGNVGCLLTVETITIGEEPGEPENIPVTGLGLDLTAYSAKVGDGFYINPVVKPSNATNRAVTWKSNATSIATVDGNGYVTCKAEGNAVITCTTVDGGFTATCSVSVAAADSGGDTEVTLTSISATYSGGDVAVGTAVNDLTGIVVTAHYSDGTSETVTGYTLSGTIAEGSNTITASYGGKTTTFAVTGVAESTGGKVQFSTLELTSGGIKADGTAHTLGGTYYAVIPYTDGMYIRTLWNTGWAAKTYPPVLVETNGNYTPVTNFNIQYDDDGTTKQICAIGSKMPHMVDMTLSGYPAGSRITVNMLIGNAYGDDSYKGLSMDDSDWLYYIPGGES